MLFKNWIFNYLKYYTVFLKILFKILIPLLQVLEYLVLYLLWVLPFAYSRFLLVDFEIFNWLVYFSSLNALCHYWFCFFFLGPSDLSLV